MQKASMEKLGDITTMTIELSNVKTIRNQLQQTVQILKNELEQLKKSQEQQDQMIGPIDHVMSDAHKKQVAPSNKDMPSLLIQVNANHQKELQKRDQIIKKLEDLFSGVQETQSEKQIEFEAKLKAMTQKYNGFITKIRTDLETTKSENTTLKEQLTRQEEELKAFKLDDQPLEENNEGQPEQN